MQLKIIMYFALIHLKGSLRLSLSLKLGQGNHVQVCECVTERGRRALVRVREQVLLGLVRDTQSVSQSYSHSADVKFEWRLRMRLLISAGLLLHRWQIGRLPKLVTAAECKRAPTLSLSISLFLSLSLNAANCIANDL